MRTKDLEKKWDPLEGERKGKRSFFNRRPNAGQKNWKKTQHRRVRAARPGGGDSQGNAEPEEKRGRKIAHKKKRAGGLGQRNTPTKKKGGGYRKTGSENAGGGKEK